MTSRCSRFTMVLFFFVVPFVGRAAGADFDDLANLIAADGASQDAFGISVSVDGDVALVGAIADDDDGEDSGSAYIYRFDGADWTQEQKLTASDGAQGDRFGCAVAVSGDVAVVGARSNDEKGLGAGAAYVYRFDGSVWVEEQKLTASDAAFGDGLGTSVAAHGSVALLGSTFDDDNGIDSGSAYLFRFDGSSWVEEQKILASDGAMNDFYGTSVALGEGVALVGANGDDDSGGSSGSVYVLRFDGSVWVDEQKLTASDGADGDFFGWSVSLSGNVALVGADSDDDLGDDSGSAYVFRFDGSTWVEEQKLTASDGAEDDSFGHSVCVDGSTALVGAPSNGNQGAAYVYRFDVLASTWSEDQKLTASDAMPFDSFGRSVAIDFDMVVVGTTGNDDNGSGSGSAYTFGRFSCLEGTVNGGNGSIHNMLYVAGSSGGPDRTVEVEGGDPLTVALVKPVTGGNGKFVLHGNEGAPTILSQTALPFELGTTCFPFLLSSGAMPVVVANNIGKTNLLGESEFFGVPIADPGTATTFLSFPILPVGTVLTFQGVIFDPATLSSKGASTTNAVIVEVVP